MSNNEAKALEAKNKGNAAFQNGKFEEAVKHFTEAIGLDPANHVLYSNRSGAYASLKDYNNALEDARKTVELKSDWGKGYSRLGSALYFLGRFEEAARAYEKGVAIEPSNQQLQQGLQEAQSAAFSQKLYGAFQGDVIANVRNNPKLAPFLSQPDFVAKLSEIKANPQALLKHLGDPRIATLLTSFGGGDEDEVHKEEQTSHKTPEVAPKAQEPKSEPESKKPQEEKDIQSELTENQKNALVYKNNGNELYKQKKFDEAIAEYDKAIALEPDNFTYRLNKSAALFEKGELDTCIQECQEIVDQGRAKYVDYQLIAKALFRMGNSFVKQEKYAEAVEAYNKSLTEHRLATTLSALKKAEKLKKEKEDKEYVNPEVSLQEKEKGNEAFKKHLYPEAVKHYTDAIRRNPSDHTIYSNRAACYTKLGSLDYALKDCDQCLALCPTFVKAFIRKGLIYFMMKDYRKALEIYDEGLKLDGENAELIEGAKKAIDAINAMQRSGEADPEVLKRAMADPEIQGILRDPTIQKVLSDLQSNPAAAGGVLRNPDIAAKLEKLAQAGILRMG